MSYNGANLNSDYGYYNVVIVNYDDTFKPAEFTEFRKNAILGRMEDFQLCVARFSIPSSSIPLFIFEKPNGVDFPYVLTFINNANPAQKVQQPVVYLQSLVNSATVYPYNNAVYSYQSFLDMINTAINTAWTAYKVAYLPANTDPAPFFDLGDDGVISFYTITTSDLFYPANPTGIEIIFSQKLWMFLNSFRGFFYGTAGKLNDPKMNYRLEVIRKKTPLNTVVLDTLDWLEQRQEYPSLYLMNQLKRIIITTGLPIENEFIGTSDSEGNPISQAILTDFEIPPDTTGQQRQNIYYFPANEPRWINFASNGILSRMDLRIYFQMARLEEFPLMLQPNSEITVKLQLKRREAKNLMQYSGTTNI